MKTSPTLPTPKWTSELNRAFPFLQVWWTFQRRRLHATLPEDTELKALVLFMSQPKGWSQEWGDFVSKFIYSAKSRKAQPKSTVATTVCAGMGSWGNRLYNQPLWGLSASISSFNMRKHGHITSAQGLVTKIFSGVMMAPGLSVIPHV